MENEKFLKAKKNLRLDIIFLGVLEIIILILLIILFFNGLKMSFHIVTTIITIILLFINYTLVQKENKIAGIIGCVIGGFMIITILSQDIVDFLLGLCVLLHSIKYLQTFPSVSSNKKNSK